MKDIGILIVGGFFLILGQLPAGKGTFWPKEKKNGRIVGCIFIFLYFVLLFVSQ